MKSRVPNIRTKISSKRLALLSGASAAMLLIPFQARALDSNALPEGGLVVGGEAILNYSIPSELHVYQMSDRAVIDWKNFNIGTEALTQFHQPSSSSLAVNRVAINDGDPTQILGRLSANGKIMILDPNGVFFGAGSRIDVGAIIASTGTVTTENAMKDAPIYIDHIDTGGMIVNYGSITAADAGLAAFVAPTVLNHGIISARLGSIDIGAGSKATIDLYGDGLVSLELTQPMQQTIANTGILSADGGTIHLQAAVAKDIVNNVISNTGIIAANSVGMDKKGRIILSAAGSRKSASAGMGVTINDGYLSASGYNNLETGGNIDVLGDSVFIGSSSVIDASGDLGGGGIRIGGDYLGSGDVPAALYSYIAEDSLILNNALTLGNGGRTIIWSDNTTDFHGSIIARGGTQGGNGGFVETSGKINLMADGYVDLTALNGDKGTYLLDPADITIYGNFAPTDIAGLQLWLDAQTLSSLSNGDEVTTWDNLAAVNTDAAGITDTPSYSSTAFGGRGGVSYGTDDILTANGFPVTSVFTVARSNNAAFGNYEGILGGDIANPGNGHILNGWAGSTSLYSGATNNFFSARQNGFSAPNGLFTNINAANGWIGSFVGPSAITNAQTWVGKISGGSRGWNGQIGEIIAYSGQVTDPNRTLLEQYQSAKWGIALDPLAGASTEAAEAMDAAGGYGVFTTRYLERLSATANIALQAGNSITLDFKGDTLTISDDRSISLSTTTGDITTASAGSITTNRTGAGGNIAFNAGDDIVFSHAFTLNAQNGGNIQLNAADFISASPALTVLNGELAVNAEGITGTYIGRDAVLNSNTGTINATVSFDTLDIDGAGASLLSGYIGAAGSASQEMANLITIAGQAGTGNTLYTFANFNIGYIAPKTNNTVLNKISSVIQQISAMASSEKIGETAKDDLVEKSGKNDSHSVEAIARSAACLVSLENVGCVVQ